MAGDYTVVFKILEDESEKVIGGINLSDVAECSEIAELVKLSEALKEPEPLSFLMG